MKNRNLLKYHASAWAFFILYEISAVFVMPGHLSSLQDYAIHYTLNILLFYAFSLFVFPLAYGTGKFRFLVLIPAVLAGIIIYYLFSFAANALLETLRFTTTWSIANRKVFLIATVWRGIYILALSIGYWFALHFFKTVRENFALTQDQ